MELTVSVIFGGSKNAFPKTLDDIRCLLDHLQSASYPSEQQSGELEDENNGADDDDDDVESEMEKHGINITAYFVDWHLDVYQMNAAQVLSLDYDNFNFIQKNKNATKLENLSVIHLYLSK